MKKRMIKGISIGTALVFCFFSISLRDADLYAGDFHPGIQNYDYSESYILNPVDYAYNYENFGNNINFQKKDKSESGSGSSFNLGTLHKIIGYTALISAGVAGYSGAMMKFKYKKEDKGPGYLSGMHETFTSATIGLFSANVVLGLYQFHDYIGADAQHNTHILLLSLATIGFIVAPAMGDKFKKPQHASVAIGSGVAAIIGITVLKF